MTTTRSVTNTAIRDMVVVIDLAGDHNSAKLAVDLAGKVGAHLTGLALAYDPITPAYSMAAPIPADFMVAAREQALGDAKQAAASFEEIARISDLSVETQISDVLVGDGFGGVIDRTMLCDLAVIGQDNPDHPEPLRDVLTEQVMFHADVPSLLVPHGGPSEFTADHAMIAWNGSTTAAQAVRSALPLLVMSKKVTVVIVEGGRKRKEIAGADLATYLARHDLDVTVRTISRTPSGIGQTLIDFAGDEGVDWMVMGAYGHSRLREFILGGTTSRILKSMTVPVLMGH